MTIDEHALAAELLARQGATTDERLTRLGIGRRAVDTLVRVGRLRRAGNGVLVSTSWPNTRAHQMAVACAVTGGVVCFPTAGEHWGLRKSPIVDDVHVLVEEHRRIATPPGVVVHRTRFLPKHHVVRGKDGIAVTSPPRTAHDAAAVLDRDRLESLIESGIDAKYFIVSTLVAMGRECGRPGRRGSGRFAAVIGSRPAWQRAVRSDYELRLERAMRERGFPRLVREHRVVLYDGEIIHPDLGIPEHGFFVEVDHLTWHGRRSTSANDRRRDLKAGASGYHVERVSDIAIDHHLARTVDELWLTFKRLVA